MELAELTSIYPTLFFFWGYCFFLLLMIISLVTGFLGDIDLPFEIDVDIDSESFSIMAIFFPQRLGQLPLLVCLSIIFFVATAISFAIQDYLLLLEGTSFKIVATIALFLIFFASLHITSLLLKPFDRFLSQKHAFATVNYIGMIGTVKTPRVTHNFGEIPVLDHSGREDYLNVYCHPESDDSPKLAYGSKVLIISFNQDNQRYLVTKAEQSSSNLLQQK